MTRSVFISGSARGIGRATALTLAERGWIVGVYDLLEEFEWAADLVTSGKIRTGLLDVTDPEFWEAALADFTSHTGGTLDVLVNNAGILYGGAFMDEGAYARDGALVDVNLKGTLNGCRAAHPYLAATPSAKVVNVCSAAAIYGTPDMAVYSATKFGVRGITEALDLEWEQDDIAVRSVWPLYAKTAMLDGVETSGTKRMGVSLTPEDVAVAVADVVEAPRKTPAQVHYPVGRKTKLMYAGSHFSPAWLTRFINAKLTSGRKVRL